MLKRLHENYIKRADAGIMAGRVPIEPRKVEPPLQPVERWREVNSALVKRYTFRKEEQRSRFVCALLEYEEQAGHHATIVIEKMTVGLRVTTHGVDVITELDKEYAKFADVLYRDVINV